MPLEKKTVMVGLTGTLRDAVIKISAEVAERDDVLDDRMSDPDVARQLLKWAIVEHRAGRGPWPKR